MNPVIWSAIFTGVIAVETLLYVVFTVGLWRATKMAAEAAKTSAEASKQSTEITASLHRPFIGLGRLAPRTDQNSRTWIIAWTVKNFGTLPGLHVDAALDWKVGVNGGTGSGPSSAEIFPQAEVESIVRFLLDETVHRQLILNDQILELHARIRYVAADGRQFVHTAEAQWKCEVAAFAVLSSKTESTNG
jgi:hypothetical protein